MMMLMKDNDYDDDNYGDKDNDVGDKDNDNGGLHNYDDHEEKEIAR